jgi:hypothetical protein
MHVAERPIMGGEGGQCTVEHASIGALAGDACAYELVLASGLGRVRILVAGSGGESPRHTPTRIPVAHLRALQNT